MLTVYHSNQVDILKSLVSELMQRQPLGNVFQPEVIIVQSQGMAQWLQIELANEIGIAAHIDFPFPTQFIDNLYYQLFSDKLAVQQTNSELMTWRLFSLLPKIISMPIFSPLNYYLSIDKQEKKCFQLANRLAYLFDQYLVYRPDWIIQWESGKNVPELAQHPAEVWQAELWRELVNTFQDVNRAVRYQKIKSFLSFANESVLPLKHIPERIFIFGITSLPPIYLSILEELARHIDVHLMFANPCKEYWGDIIDKKQASSQPENQPNSLLRSWGKLGRDNLFLLQDLTNKQDIDAFADLEKTTLLSSIQNDILHLYEDVKTKQLIVRNDNSITFHACHSEQREVEVLYDYLLSILDANPTIELRDCIVMVSDIDRYVPYIQAVFGNAEQSRYLPFTISDQKAQHIDPIVQGFFAILNFPHSRLTAEEIFSLLEIPAITERFSINITDLTILKKWIMESGIRFGIDTPHGWLFGLERLLLGYVIDEESGSWNSIFPYNSTTGADAELIGQLIEFISVVKKWLHKLSITKPLSEWQSCCVELFNDFFMTQNNNQSVILMIIEEWQTLIETAILANFTDKVSIDILHDAMQARLDNHHFSHRFLIGKINFCTMLPMRSIPFKVVCLLGMNDGVYPRTQLPLNFDLITQKPRRGDRSRRHDDRYLFLEALLSAEQKLYISYIGKDIKDNSDRYPSVLVNELWEYINQHYHLNEPLDQQSGETSLSFLHVTHTRTPFNPQNYLNEPKSYADEWLPAAEKAGVHHPFMDKIEPASIDNINLDELKRFYQHTIKLFFQKRFNYYLPDLEKTLPDTENFNLNGLERYQLNQKILEQFVEPDFSEKKVHQLYENMAFSGVLPDGKFGQIIYETQIKTISSLAEKVKQEWLQSDKLEVNMIVNQYPLQGWLTHVQPDGILKWRPSKLSIRDGIDIWIDHLIYSQLHEFNNHTQNRIYGLDENEWRFSALPKDEAAKFLAILVEGYVQGLNKPLFMPIKSAWNWLTHAYDHDTNQIQSDKKSDRQLINTWQGDFNRLPERDDYYLRLFSDLNDDIMVQVKENAQRFLLPILLHLHTKNQN